MPEKRERVAMIALQNCILTRCECLIVFLKINSLIESNYTVFIRFLKCIAFSRYKKTYKCHIYFINYLHVNATPLVIYGTETRVK